MRLKLLTIADSVYYSSYHKKGKVGGSELEDSSDSTDCRPAAKGVLPSKSIPKHSRKETSYEIT